jgi:hypothetical protein
MHPTGSCLENMPMKKPLGSAAPKRMRIVLARFYALDAASSSDRPTSPGVTNRTSRSGAPVSIWLLVPPEWGRVIRSLAHSPSLLRRTTSSSPGWCVIYFGNGTSYGAQTMGVVVPKGWGTIITLAYPFIHHRDLCQTLLAAQHDPCKCPLSASWRGIRICWTDKPRTVDA